MSFPRPALTELISRIESDMSSRLLSGAPVLRRSFLGVLARVFAGAVHMLYGYGQWIAKQILPTTADAEYLELHAETWGIVRLSGSYATGTAVFTGVNGSVIPEGAVVQRGDGVQYKVDADATITAGSATVNLTAMVSGAESNALVSTIVALVNPVVGVNQSGSIGPSAMTGGVDRETDEQLRTRLLQRLQNPPMGGALADYEAWAYEVSGVYKPFVFPLYDAENDVYPAPGHVGVTCIVADGDRIPDASLITSIQNHLDIVAPVTANVKVYAPTKVEVDFEIAISPNTSAVREAIRAEIASLFDREGAPNVTIPVSHINEAISIAVGEYDHSLIAPFSDIIMTRSEYPVPNVGTIVFTTL